MYLTSHLYEDSLLFIEIEFYRRVILYHVFLLNTLNINFLKYSVDSSTHKNRVSIILQRLYETGDMAKKGFIPALKKPSI